MFRRVSVAALAGVTIALSSTSLTTAQSPSEYQIAVAHSSINLPVSVPGVPNLGVALKSLTARVGAVTCTSEVLAGALSDVVLHIGAPGQPAECSQQGALVRLVDGNGLTLDKSFNVRLGERDTLGNLAPVPPHSIPREDPPPGPPVEFRVIVPAAIMAEPASGPRGDTLGELLETVSVFADRVFCGSAEVVNITSDAVLRLGFPGQATACGRAGARVTFGAGENAKDNPIGPAIFLTPGSQYALTSFGRSGIGNPSTVVPTTPVQEAPVVNEFQLIIAASLFNTGGVNSPGSRFRTLSGLANGVVCEVKDISSLTQDLTMRFGLPGQPEICSVEGATVTLVVGEATRLAESWELKKGTQVALQRIGVQPPSPSGAGPSRSDITPPDTGNAGMR